MLPIGSVGDDHGLSGMSKHWNHIVGERFSVARAYFNRCVRPGEVGERSGSGAWRVRRHDYGGEGLFLLTKMEEYAILPVLSERWREVKVSGDGWGKEWSGGWAEPCIARVNQAELSPVKVNQGELSLSIFVGCRTDPVPQDAVPR